MIIINTTNMSHYSSKDSPTVWSVSAFHDGNFMFQTDFSNSKTHMTRVLEECTTMDLSKLEFQMYRSSPKGPVFVNTSSVKSLSHMTLEKYKGGLLLRPMDDDDRWGEKYFMGGWWMPQHESWFFKMCEFDNLIDHGAEYISDVVVIDNDTDSDMPDRVSGAGSGTDNEDQEQEFNTGSVDLTSLDIEPYGKGYLVRAPKDHKDYGTKYYGSGWWNSNQEGWFFKKEHYDEIVGYGAVEYQPDVLEFVQAWGRGYVLKPLKSHPHYGSKYYRNGWWNDQKKWWFFKREFVDEETMTVM